MVAIHETVDVSALPLAPKNPMPYRETMRALRNFHTGFEQLRVAGGPVSRVEFGPRWLFPPMVVVTSPRGGRDMIGRSDAFVDKASVHLEVRKLLGGNLFNLPHNEWLPRRRSLQHVFTKKHVLEFGGHMAEAAQTICDGWPDPLTSDPERFRPDRAKQIERYQYLPFGAGPRSCIGDHFAMLEATLALATIIGRCEIGSLTDDFPVAVPFTVVASEPVRAIVVKR